MTRAAALGLAFAVMVGCGPAGNYSRLGGTGAAGGAELPDADVGTGGTGAGGSTGSGGVPVGTGGAPDGTGGAASTGSGGRGTGGFSQTGGAPSATGGMSQSGGRPGSGGMGGQGTGGQGTGGQATGGQGTGGQGMGGQGTGGQATGGQGTGGRGTGGAPTRLILSVDFVGGRATAATAMADSEMAGARPAAHWNSANGPMGTLANLTLSDGTTSASTITWNAPFTAPSTGIYTVGYADAPGDVRMMNGYLDPTWSAIPTTAPTVLTISGLPAAIAAGTYDVYLYTLGYVTTDMRSYQYAVGSLYQSVTQNSNPTDPPASPFPYVSANDPMVGTHVVFERVTGSSVSVTAKPVSGTNNRFRAPINGIQIVWPAGS